MLLLNVNILLKKSLITWNHCIQLHNQLQLLIQFPHDQMVFVLIQVKIELKNPKLQDYIKKKINISFVLIQNHEN